MGNKDDDWFFWFFLLATVSLLPFWRTGALDELTKIVQIFQILASGVVVVLGIYKILKTIENQNKVAKEKRKIKFQPALISPKIDDPNATPLTSYKIGLGKSTIGMRITSGYTAKLNDFSIILGFANHRKDKNVDVTSSILKIVNVYDLKQGRNPGGLIVLRPKTAKGGYDQIGNRWMGSYKAPAGDHVSEGKCFWLGIEVEACKPWEGYLYFEGTDSDRNHATAFTQNKLTVASDKK